MQQYDDATLQHWIDMVLVCGQDLTQWEKQFICSIEDKLAKHRGLSNREIGVLDTIYRNRVP